MRYKRVITLLATASLAVSIPVTTLAAETTSQSLSEQGESNHTDTQEETDTISDTESEPQIEVPQSQEPTIPQLPDTLLEEETLLWSSIFVTLMANKIGGLQFGIYRNGPMSRKSTN